MRKKTYSAQGCAARMLQLVTKQARMEAEDYVINLDKEHAIKRVKSKDKVNDMLLKKREHAPMLKEVDEITTTCSSRQEKISQISEKETMLENSKFLE